MSSVVAGFEYDIFISYRQNDNRSGWVTEFVKNLNEELAASIKESVSVYFDSNPHDGLAQTHDVDESLKGKLKCLIFIPILSQTYCDSRSFAWRSEFLAYKKSTSEDQFGLKIKLQNGNVASRILPVRIHELDVADQQLVESELGILRPVDFVYHSSGVVRPLLAAEEDPKANLNHTYYRDQINKVARGVKELIVAMSAPAAEKRIPETKPEEIPSSWKRKMAFGAAGIILLGILSFAFFYFSGFKSEIKEPDRSIAVLPFENMNKDPEQDYFSNGIAEDILNHLVKISDLKVKSRTSTLQYKGTTKTAPVIGEELGVSNIVEGSVRRVGEKVRIVVQLIDAKTDTHLWSETYDRDLKDVLALQSEIAIEIAKALEARLTAEERQSIKKEIATDVTAYDYFLKARAIMNNYGGNRSELDQALSLVNESIHLDNHFSKSYSLRGNIWSNYSSFGFSESVWTDSSLVNASRAIELDPASSDGYILKSYVLRFLGKIDGANKLVEKAYEIDPTNAEVQSNYGYLLLNKGDEQGADIVIKGISNQFKVQDPQYYVEMNGPYYYLDDTASQFKLLRKAMSLNPGSVYIRFNLSNTLLRNGRFEEALSVLQDIDQNNASTIDAKAFLSYFSGDYKTAAKEYERYKEIESAYQDSTQSIPFRHRLAMTYLKLGRKKEADKLIAEHETILYDMIIGKRGKGTWTNLGGIYYDYALCLSYEGKKSKAIASLDSAYKYGWRVQWFYHNDPLLENVKNESDFKKVQKKVDEFHAFRKQAFSNALNRAQASRELKGLLDK